MTTLKPNLHSESTEGYGQGSKDPLLITIQPSSKPSGSRRLETIILVSLFFTLGFLTLARTAWLNGPTPSKSGSNTINVPDYFQTSPELFPGPTATGTAPFLAETNPAATVPNTPLETGQSISGASNHNIFELMGNLSPYFPNPRYEGIGATSAL